MQTTFTKEGWEDYLYWQSTDKKTLKKINQIIKDIQRTPFSGIGKPEPLRHQLTGCWSRRINNEHRFVYSIREESLIILQCRYHYHNLI